MFDSFWLNLHSYINLFYTCCLILSSKNIILWIYRLVLQTSILKEKKNKLVSCNLSTFWLCKEQGRQSTVIDRLLSPASHPYSSYSPYAYILVFLMWQLTILTVAHFFGKQ